MAQMNLPTENVERRRQPRLKVRDVAFAVLGDGEEMGQVMDINLLGLSFHYLTDGSEKPTCDSMDIILAEDDLHIRDIPFRRVLDLEILNGMTFSSLKKHRYGVEFGELSAKQRAQLDHFIRHHTAGSA